MANEEQLERLKQGISGWNKWRRNNPTAEINLNGANLSKADLNEAFLSGVDLSKTDLSEANFGSANLRCANLSESHLSRANLKWANLSGADLSRANFSRADFSRANLSRANLSGKDLSGKDLSGKDLSGADLSRIQALETNFTGAVFTGACIEDWNINSQTKLDDVQCDYIYLKYPDQERRPSDPNRNFAPGEFTKLFQRALTTVDLIFRNGVDWQALLISLEKLRVEADGAELSIQAIENKNDGAFVVRVNAPPEADKAEVEKFLKQEYEVALTTLEARYELQLQLQGEQLAFYREEMAAKRQDNTQLMGVIQVMAENQAPKYDMRGSNIGNFIDTAQAGSQQSNVQFINMSQDLSQAAGQIQELLNQLQRTGVTAEVAQEQVATDLANQAKSNPTVMGKLVGWGQTLATKARETTVSEAAKAIVP
ncbi:MAG: pentapeptide repeat-containing protein [Oscillatoriales cyanobacterium C42_A2020_001]|nr:pentapeptide repeat-containing protein [Leptolyngbyaceae cyanobacterium C42_A2020_001]